MPSSNASAPTVIAFDLDGTLVDTAPDLLDTLDLILVEAGATPLPHEETRKMIGAGVKALVTRGLDAAGVTIDEPTFHRLEAKFLEHYAAHIADRSRPFPGLVEALDELSARGYALAVCTNKLEYLARMLMDQLGLTDRFAIITGGDTFPVKKPEAGHLLGTITGAGGTPQRAIMVGDSLTDVLAARNAGVPSIVVPFGYTDIPAQELGGDAFIDRFDLLPEAVERLLIQR